MAVTLGAITLATLFTMAANATGAGASIAKIAEALRAKGHPPDKPIPVDAQLAAQKAMDELQALPADFGTLALAERTQIQGALEAVRSIYIASEQIGEYRATALKALYQLAEFLDDHA